MLPPIFFQFAASGAVTEKNCLLWELLEKNKRELPPEFIATKARNPKTTLFAFQKNATILSYVPKKNKNVLLVSTMHLEDNSIDENSGLERKPNIIITFYNETKAGVDVVDELCGTYSVSRKTNRWQLVLFYRIIQYIAGINSQIDFTANNKKNMLRREYLQDLLDGKLRKRALDTHFPKKIRAKSCRINLDNISEPTTSTSKSRCSVCPCCKDIKTKFSCAKCFKKMCLKHMKNICEKCLHPDECKSEESDG